VRGPHVIRRSNVVHPSESNVEPADVIEALIAEIEAGLHGDVVETIIEEVEITRSTPDLARLETKVAELEAIIESLLNELNER
jgi:hypothetical protein